MKWILRHCLSKANLIASLAYISCNYRFLSFCLLIIVSVCFEPRFCDNFVPSKRIIGSDRPESEEIGSHWRFTPHLSHWNRHRAAEDHVEFLTIRLDITASSKPASVRYASWVLFVLRGVTFGSSRHSPKWISCCNDTCSQHELNCLAAELWARIVLPVSFLNFISSEYHDCRCQNY